MWSIEAWTVRHSFVRERPTVVAFVNSAQPQTTPIQIPSKSPLPWVNCGVALCLLLPLVHLHPFASHENIAAEFRFSCLDCLCTDFQSPYQTTAWPRRDCQSNWEQACFTKVFYWIPKFIYISRFYVTVYIQDKTFT